MRLKAFRLAPVTAFVAMVLLSGCSTATDSIRDPRIATEVARSDVLNVSYRPQTSQVGCGIAPLSSVLAYYDVPNELSTLEQVYKLDAEGGYSMGKLATVAQTFWLKAFVVKMDNAAARKQIQAGRPVIVPIRKDVYGYTIGDTWIYKTIKTHVLDHVMDEDSLYFNHYVALIGMDDGNFWILDPDEGMLSIDGERLARMRRTFDDASLMVGR